MTAAEVIYSGLLHARDLEASVKTLDDADLVKVSDALARGDFGEWPAGRVHGMCIVEGHRRFVGMVKAETLKSEKLKSADRCHGSEVSQ